MRWASAVEPLRRSRASAKRNPSVSRGWLRRAAVDADAARERSSDGGAAEGLRRCDDGRHRVEERCLGNA